MRPEWFLKQLASKQLVDQLANTYVMKRLAQMVYSGYVKTSHTVNKTLEQHTAQKPAPPPPTHQQHYQQHQDYEQQQQQQYQQQYEDPNKPNISRLKRNFLDNLKKEWDKESKRMK